MALQRSGQSAAMMLAVRAPQSHPAMIAFSILRASIKAIISRGANTSFASLKQIEAGALNVGYAETGPTNGPRYFFRTAGHTTFVMSTWRRCWRRRAIVRSSPICAAIARRAFFPAPPSERSAVGYRRRLVLGRSARFVLLG